MRTHLPPGLPFSSVSEDPGQAWGARMPSLGGAASSQDGVPLGQGRRAGSAGKGTPGRTGEEWRWGCGWASPGGQPGRGAGWTPPHSGGPQLPGRRHHPRLGRERDHRLRAPNQTHPSLMGEAAGGGGQRGLPGGAPPTRRTRGAPPPPPSLISTAAVVPPRLPSGGSRI